MPMRSVFMLMTSGPGVRPTHGTERGIKVYPYLCAANRELSEPFLFSVVNRVDHSLHGKENRDI